LADIIHYTEEQGMKDIVTLGELLIDFTPCGTQDNQQVFMQNPGGAVANVVAAAAGFGMDTAFLGMVGDDVFGRYLTDVLQSRGVDVSGLKTSAAVHTTLAFVHLFPNGDRDFSFYRKPGADIMYTADDLAEEAIRNARVFHFGSLSLTDEPVRTATMKALEIAKGAGVTVSYDPNYRAPLWNSADEAKKYMLQGMEYADILKISDNEVQFLFGDIGLEDAARMLVKRGAKLVFVTLGSEGAVYASSEGTGREPGFPARAVDTTGAGDCFTAGVLSQYIKCGNPSPSLSDIAGFVRFGNAAASLCVEKRGGIPSMPTMELVQKRLMIK
jgi:fructokinase